METDAGITSKKLHTCTEVGKVLQNKNLMQANEISIDGQNGQNGQGGPCNSVALSPDSMTLPTNLTTSNKYQFWSAY